MLHASSMIAAVREENHDQGDEIFHSFSSEDAARLVSVSLKRWLIAVENLTTLRNARE
jgi:hypothetical protein